MRHLNVLGTSTTIVDTNHFIWFGECLWNHWLCQIRLQLLLLNVLISYFFIETTDVVGTQHAFCTRLFANLAFNVTSPHIWSSIDLRKLKPMISWWPLLWLALLRYLNLALGCVWIARKVIIESSIGFLKQISNLWSWRFDDTRSHLIRSCFIIFLFLGPEPLILGLVKSIG